jgi:hypothetical protein
MQSMQKKLLDIHNAVIQIFHKCLEFVNEEYTVLWQSGLYYRLVLKLAWLVSYKF